MDSERLRVGKEAEKHITNKLTSMGYIVIDISYQEFCTSAGTFYSPFDILAVSDHYSFVADIKYRKTTRYVPISTNRFISYNQYIPSRPINDKLLILSFPKQDLYITIDDVQKNCNILGPYYTIELYQTQSLVALRKALESGDG